MESNGKKDLWEGFSPFERTVKSLNYKWKKATTSSVLNKFIKLSL